MESKLVSVYISTHNRVEKLKRAVNSVLNQTYNNIEIIICDDASTDDTFSYVQYLMKKETRVSYLRNDTNQGACAARNLGISKAKGYYITGLDDDDVFDKNRIEIFVNNWEDKYSFLCCDFIERFSNGFERKYYNKNNSKIITFEELLLENEASNQIFTLTERLQSIGGFDIKARRLQDWDTWIRLSYQYGNGKRLPDANYIMNHDHSANEVRVSKSYPLAEALNDLLSRNKNLYNEEMTYVMQFIISCVRGNANFINAIKTLSITRNIKYLGKYFKSKLNTSESN